jgi:hypothetical protein
MLKHQRIAKSCLEIQKSLEEPTDIDILNPNDLKIVKRNDGYVNLTLLCQSGNEQYKRWIRMTRVTKNFLPNLSIKLKKPKSELIKQGGTQTWGHADIVPDIVKWMTDLRRKRISRAPQQVNTEGESKEEESDDSEEESKEEEEEVFESVGAPSIIPNAETPLVVDESHSESGNDDESNVVEVLTNEIKELFQEFKLMLSDGKELSIPMRKDGYVNATLLCKASGKKRLDNWMCLESTKKLLQEFSNSLDSQGVKSIDCLQGRYGGTFIHPDLAVQLAQWISPSFALQVSRWIRELMLTGREEESDDSEEESKEGESKEEESKEEEEEEVFESVGAPSIIPNAETPSVVDESHSGESNNIDHELQKPQLIQDTTFKLKLLNNEILDIAIRKDGYINATQLCKAGNKLFGHYQTSKQTQDYLQALSSNIGIPIMKLLDSKVGGSHSGTYVHRKVAYHLAQWISPQFAVQVSNVLDELMLTGRVELGKEKTNAELEDIFEKQRTSLDYQNYLGKDVLYFFEFTPDRNGLEEPTLLDNKELHFFEFGFTSNIQQRTSSSDYPRPNYRLDKLFVYDSGFKTSLAEKYTKNICYDLGLKIDYFKKKECLKATYKDLDKVYELITKHQIRSQEDNEMCKYEIEKMRLEYEIMKLRQNNSIISLLEKGVLTYDQMKEMFSNSIL